MKYSENEIFPILEMCELFEYESNRFDSGKIRFDSNLNFYDSNLIIREFRIQMI